jgi:hypothetical protein
MSLVMIDWIEYLIPLHAVTVRYMNKVKTTVTLCCPWPGVMQREDLRREYAGRVTTHWYSRHKLYHLVFSWMNTNVVWCCYFAIEA